MESENGKRRPSVDNVEKDLIKSEWLSLVGSMVMSERLETAEHMALVTNEVVEFATECLRKAKSCKSVATSSVKNGANRPKNEKAPNDCAIPSSVKTTVIKPSTSHSIPLLSASSSKTETQPGLPKKADTQADLNNGKEEISAPNVNSRPLSRTTVNIGSNHAGKNVLIIMGEWPAQRLNEVHQLIFFNESLCEVMTKLRNCDLLQTDVAQISILSNKKWTRSLATVTEAIDKMEEFCKLLHFRCPHAKIRVAGFYSKNIHMPTMHFNCSATRLAGDYDYVEYADLGSLIPQNQFAFTQNNGLTRTTIQYLVYALVHMPK